MVYFSFNFDFLWFSGHMTNSRVKSLLALFKSILQYLSNIAIKKTQDEAVMATITQTYKKLVHLAMLVFYISEEITLPSNLQQVLVFIASVPWLCNVSTSGCEEFHSNLHSLDGIYYILQPSLPVWGSFVRFTPVIIISERSQVAIWNFHKFCIPFSGTFSFMMTLLTCNYMIYNTVQVWSTICNLQNLHGQPFFA